MFRKILVGFIAFLLIAILIVAIFFRQESYQLYKVLTFFEPDKISDNFKGAKDIFPTRKVPASPDPYHFPIGKNDFQLPGHFNYEDSVVNTQDFLDHTLTDALLIVHRDTLKFEYYSNNFQPMTIIFHGLCQNR